MIDICKQPDVQPFRHDDSGTWSYVVSDPGTGDAVVIDPVMDFEYRAGRLTSESADELLDCVRVNELKVRAILETHAHADHVSASPHLRSHWSVPLMIGAGIVEVQARFCQLFNLQGRLAVDGSQFDRLLQAHDELRFGALAGQVMVTPGHTSDSCSYLFGDAVFVGDTLFAPDYGTARCDFPGGDAGLLFDSIQKLYQLPDETRVFLCHDYPPAERSAMAQTSIGAEKADNIHISSDTRRDAFVKMRKQRDATLAVPELLLPAVQLNINAGAAMPPEDNGIQYLKVPLNQMD